MGLAGAILWIALACLPGAGLAVPDMPRGMGIVLAQEDGQIIYSRNAEQCFVPASTLKVFTALAALDHFGPDYRFPVKASYDPVSQDLYIRGMGDPIFISEAIDLLARNLIRHFHLESVRHIILDNGYFSPDIQIPGTGNSRNPYDATTGALCANFNTIAFQWNAEQKHFVSPEPQTPAPQGMFLTPVRASGQKRGRILLSPRLQALYPGFLIQHYLEQAGVRVTGTFQTGAFPSQAQSIHIVESPYPMTEVIRKLLKYSNNFIANQLMLTMGAQRQGEPAQLDKGMVVLRKFARRMGLEDVSLAEASGLSRKNRITPVQMLKILSAFRPYIHLLRETPEEFYKTGTLSNVRSRVGFIKGRNKKKYPFVVFLNQQTKGYEKIMADLIQRIHRLESN